MGRIPVLVGDTTPIFRVVVYMLLWAVCLCFLIISSVFVVNSFKFGWSHPHSDWYFEPQAPSKMVDADHQSDLHNCWLP